MEVSCAVRLICTSLGAEGLIWPSFYIVPSKKEMSWKEEVKQEKFHYEIYRRFLFASCQMLFGCLRKMQWAGYVTCTRKKIQMHVGFWWEKLNRRLARDRISWGESEFYRKSTAYYGLDSSLKMIRKSCRLL